MKAYPEYKASGIDWLGEIPEHWLKSRFKYFLDQITSPSTAIRKIALENIESQTGRYIETNTEFEGDGVGFILGDIVYGKLRPYLKKVWLAEFEGNAIGDFFVYRAKENANNNYIKWLFLTEDFTSIVNQSTNGAKMPRVSSDFIKDLEFFLPPIEEQETIAAYLGDVTGKVDALIAEKRKQVEDIRAYRTSIITETVTHGLNPDAPLRPSGIDWLGDIPSHWEMSRVKYVVTCNDEVLPESTDKEQEINYVEISDVSFEKGVEKSTIIKFGEAPSRARRVTKIDDVIISTVRTYLKAIAKIKVDNLIVSTGFAVLHPQLINPHFLFYSLSTSGFLEEVESHSTGVSYPAITATDLVNLSITLPPVAEQQAIADFLDAKTAKIDELISELTKQIDELTEYKQAVITEAVTGKVDVRDYKPSN